MILEKQTQSLIYQVGASHDTVDMSLDMDSAQVLMQMLSKNLYSDSIGSTIRECASNALDSHRRAGTSDPIIVSLQQSGASSSWEFSVEDFGIGLDADDVVGIISKYGKSTKRNSTTELGMMGLGFKAPLAYASSFYFTCRKDGVERKYMMYEGEETNSIDLLYEKPTSERNGVRVVIPVKYSDKYEFNQKIREQLAYFQNVYFNVDGIDNKFTIFRSEHYQVSELSDARQLHICLDDVYYPIDFSKLGISSIDVAIGLRFGLTDGLFPTPNRESIRYTQEAKKIILDKIATVANYLMDKYNETIEDTEDVLAVIDYFRNDYKHITDHNGDAWEISKILKYATVSSKNPTLLGSYFFTASDVYKMRENLLREYEGAYRLTKHWNSSTLRECKSHWDKDFNVSHIRDKVVVIDGPFPDRKRRYIKEIWKNTNALFVRKSNKLTLYSTSKGWTVNSHRNGYGDIDCYYDLLKLHKYSKDKWRAIITEYQSIVNNLTKNFISLDDIVIPEAWIIADKAKHTKSKAKITKAGVVKEKGDVNGKVAETPGRETGRNAIFTPKVYSGKTLHKLQKLHVYSKEEDRNTLDYLYGMFLNQRNDIEFIILSDREIKVLEKYELHNFMSLDKFLQCKSKPMKRMLTAYLIHDELYNVHRATFDAQLSLEKINLNLATDLKLLHLYSKPMIPSWLKTTSDIDLKKVAADNMLYDMEMYEVYRRTKKLLDAHPFINTLCGTMRGSYGNFLHSEKILDVMKDMFRYKHIRMNVDNYKITQGWVPVDENGQLELFVAC